jgi:hypothetical protein
MKCGTGIRGKTVKRRDMMGTEDMMGTGEGIPLLLKEGWLRIKKILRSDLR